MTARYIVADVFDGLASLPANSVDCVITSPPFLALRSYLPADHPDKAKELGSEPTPAAFIDALLDVVEALDRVLTPHGSICIELGDTYSGSGGAGGDYAADGLREGQPKFRQMANREHRPEGAAHRGANDFDIQTVPMTGGRGWPLAKSLCLIPESFRWALVYGRNPFNGRETPQWRARNVVRWHRPNPPVGALGDKFRPATSEMVIACKSGKRYFDLDAVREAHKDGRTSSGGGSAMAAGVPRGATGDLQSNPAGAPPLDTWIIPTEPYAGSHYATFPSALCVKPIKAMCPEKVCRTCGEPSRRMVGDAEYVSTNGGRIVDHFEGERRAEGARAWTVEGGNPGHVVRSNPTLGWTDCGHNDFRAGVVLDPFAGSGTTLSVATGHGRDAIGIDIDARNAELAVDRIGPLLCTVETLTEGVA